MEVTTVNSVQEAYNLGYEDGFKTAKTHVTVTRYVKERTCHDVETRSGFWQCSECGVQLDNPYECPTLWDGYKATVPSFCPGCGAKVVE